MIPRRMKEAEVDALTKATADAYSFDRYADWRSCVELLAEKGFTAKEAEYVLRSKLMRWAADDSENEYGQHTAGDLKAYLNKPNVWRELPRTYLRRIARSMADAMTAKARAA